MDQGIPIIHNIWRKLLTNTIVYLWGSINWIHIHATFFPGKKRHNSISFFWRRGSLFHHQAKLYSCRPRNTKIPPETLSCKVKKVERQTGLKEVQLKRKETVVVLRVPDGDGVPVFYVIFTYHTETHLLNCGLSNISKLYKTAQT